MNTLGKAAEAWLSGIFGTPVDSDHFDLDLFLDASFSPDEFGLTPALELNFDLAPDLEVWGVYIRVEEGFSGRDESTEDDPATVAVDESETKFVLAPTNRLNHRNLLDGCGKSPVAA